MSDDHNHPNYMLIWIVLLVLTVLEVLVAFFPGWLSGVPGIHLITILLLPGILPLRLLYPTVGVT